MTAAQVYGLVALLAGVGGLILLVKVYFGGKKVERLNEAAISAKGNADRAAKDAKDATGRLKKADGSAALQEAVDEIIDAGKPK